MVVPFGAGGPVDTLARILAEHMGGTLGQRLVVGANTDFQYGGGARMAANKGLKQCKHLLRDAPLFDIAISTTRVLHEAMAAGHEDGTLVNALLHHCAGRLSGIGGVAMTALPTWRSIA